jgi:hypothetical protein
LPQPSPQPAAASVLAHATRIFDKLETEDEAVAALLRANTHAVAVARHTCCRATPAAAAAAVAAQTPCAACEGLAALLQKQRKRGHGLRGDETYRRSLSRVQDQLRAATLVRLLHDAHQARTAGDPLLRCLVRRLLTGAPPVLGADHQIQYTLKVKLKSHPGLLEAVDAALVSHGTLALAHVVRRRAPSEQPKKARQLVAARATIDDPAANANGDNDDDTAEPPKQRRRRQLQQPQPQPQHLPKRRRRRGPDDHGSPTLPSSPPSEAPPPDGPPAVDEHVDAYLAMAVDGLVDEFAQPWPDEEAHHDDMLQLPLDVLAHVLEMQICGGDGGRDDGFGGFGADDVMLF